MNVIEVDETNAHYNEDLDILFAFLGDTTALDHVDFLYGGVYVAYSWPGKEIAEIGIWQFSEKAQPVYRYVILDIGDAEVCVDSWKFLGEPDVKVESGVLEVELHRIELPDGTGCPWSECFKMPWLILTLMVTVPILLFVAWGLWFMLAR